MLLKDYWIFAIEPRKRVVLTKQEIQEAISHISWRPNTVFEIKWIADEYNYETVILATQEVEDAFGDHRKCIRMRPIRIPRTVDSVKSFYQYFLYELENWDIHECREWFQIDGVPFKDPHAMDGV